MTQDHPITPPPPHLLKKFSNQAREESNKRNGAGYLKTFARLCIEWAMSCQATSNLSQIRSSEIQPPPYLLAEWLQQACECTLHDHSPGTVGGFMARKAAQWGADQELEACCEWLDREGWSGESHSLRAARRLQPPTLQERALQLLERYDTSGLMLAADQVDTIRRALEGQ
jgi:hypothetical protein